MGSSGLIYAAIVAAWAAVLVPRWVRRNEEVERAREVDVARGVRVLAQPAPLARGAGLQARHESLPIVPSDPPAPQAESRGEYGHADPPAESRSGDGQASRRRRRVLGVLVLALAAVTVASVVGALPLWAVAVPVLVLTVFIRLARRAAAAEARRPGRARSRVPAPAEAAEPASRRIGVLDQPEPMEPADPDAWEPVPVPLPTYITKPRAPEPANRTIDLSRPGAWTSGRLDPSDSAVPPRSLVATEHVEDDVDDLPEHRHAVGD